MSGGYSEVVSIGVSDHAHERFRQRFGPTENQREVIVGDVRDAFRSKRVSPDAPDGWIGEAAPGSLYAWTEDGDRIYAVNVHDRREAFVVVTVVKAGFDDRPYCEHGRRVDRYCAECTPPVVHEEPTQRSLTADLAKLTLDLGPDPLHLPEVYGVHEPRVSKAKGKWIVTCRCGNFRVVGGEDRRHFIETAWGAHRNELA